MEAFSMIDTALQLGKRLRDVSSKIKEAEIRNIIADLYISLADVKSEIATEKGEKLKLTQELASLEAEILRLKESMQLKGEVTEKRGWFFMVDENGDRKYPPICPRCWQVDSRVMYLQPVGHLTRLGVLCPECDTKLGPVPTFQD